MVGKFRTCLGYTRALMHKPLNDTSKHLVFHPAYNTDLPAYGLSKPFALDRGEMVLKELERQLGCTVSYERPQPLLLEQLALVHSQAYIDSLGLPQTWVNIFELDLVPDAQGKLPGATRPFPTIINDFLLKAGGTVLAARKSLEHGMCANLGGGYHHAFPDRGRGYCSINDVAIAIRQLQREGLIKKAMVVDVDFHQGDGTARCFGGDSNVYTFSIHSEEGWPENKQKSSLDVGILESEQDQYLTRLEKGLHQALAEFSPDYLLLVDGSDAYEKDVLPGTKFLQLKLSVMQERSELILGLFKKHGIPLSMVFAGGYGPDVWEVHFHSVKTMLKLNGIVCGVEHVPSPESKI